MLELIIKAIADWISEQKRLAAERTRGASIPMALPATVQAPKKGKKKKQHREDAVIVPARHTRRIAAPAEAELAVFEAADKPLPGARDLKRLFVLSEVLGPPLALREVEE
ncbi:MAG: hypothetical protein K8T20_17100 [Planctomycetes bacterium]|nr:hypothetical protein [Planctomycetota bacterium]